MKNGCSICGEIPFHIDYLQKKILCETHYLEWDVLRLKSFARDEDIISITDFVQIEKARLQIK